MVGRLGMMGAGEAKSCRAVLGYWPEIFFSLVTIW